MESSSPLCYTSSDDLISSTNEYFACGNVGGSGIESCCHAGDHCVASGICRTKHQAIDSTGYYMAGCTDPTLQDPLCSRQCSSRKGEYISYDVNSGQWTCCTSVEGSVRCDQPSGSIASATAPNRPLVAQLPRRTAPPQATTIATAILERATTEGAAQAPGAEATPLTNEAGVGLTTYDVQATLTLATGTEVYPTATPKPGSSSSLSPAASAGVAVACIMGAILLALVTWLIMARRARVRRMAKVESHSAPWRRAGDGGDVMWLHQRDESVHKAELPMSPRDHLYASKLHPPLERAYSRPEKVPMDMFEVQPYEMEGTSAVHELPSDSIPRLAFHAR